VLAPLSPMIASSAPTSTVSSSSVLISSRVPATGEGISVSTLSVETSSNGSSTATSSPTCLSQRVTVPSVTDSPSAGRVTGVPDPPPLPPPLPPALSPLPWALGPESSDSAPASGSASGAVPSSSAASSAVSVLSSALSSVLSWARGSSASSPESPPPSPPASDLSPITASSAPTSTVSSSSALISSRVPATGEGISVSTLSVETSSNGSSTATSSPTCLSQRVTVPSVTDSPSAGRVTGGAKAVPSVGAGSGFGSTRSGVCVQWAAGQGEVRLADGLALGGVGVQEGSDVVGVGLPPDDQLGLGDQLADAGADEVDADDRTVDPAHELHEALGTQDLAAAVAGQVVGDGGD